MDIEKLLPIGCNRIIRFWDVERVILAHCDWLGLGWL